MDSLCITLKGQGLRDGRLTDRLAGVTEYKEWRYVIRIQKKVNIIRLQLHLEKNGDYRQDYNLQSNT